MSEVSDIGEFAEKITVLRHQFEYRAPGATDWGYEEAHEAERVLIEIDVLRQQVAQALSASGQIIPAKAVVLTDYELKIVAEALELLNQNPVKNRVIADSKRAVGANISVQAKAQEAPDTAKGGTI